MRRSRAARASSEELDRFLSKPFSPLELASIVEELLAEGR